MSENRYSIKVLKEAMEVLRTLADSRAPLSPQDVANATGLDRNKAFRILSTFEDGGFVERVGDNFEVGMRIALMQNRYKATLENRRAGTDKKLHEMEEAENVK